MTTYAGTTVPEFERSVTSIMAQTRRPDEFLIVVDGPVLPDLDRSIEQAALDHPQIRVEPLPTNVGSRLASGAVGLATGDFLARHDSDDVSLPKRLELEMRAIDERGLDIVGSSMAEFAGSPEQVVGIRRVPLTHEAIVARMRFNSAINNPSVIFQQARRPCGRLRGPAVHPGLRPLHPDARAAGARAGTLLNPWFCSTPVTA